MDFEALTREHKDAVYRQMVRVCGNHEDAEDVLVEALLRAWQHLDQLDNSLAFRAWLAQIARRVCFRVRRREALMPLVELVELEAPGEWANPEHLSATAELKDLVQTALASVPPAYREVYELRDLEGLSGEEVAEKLGISVRAMKSRLHRGRNLLRERLDAALQPTKDRKGAEHGNHSRTSGRSSV